MSGLLLAIISFIRRPVSSLIVVVSLVVPLTATGLVLTLLWNSRQGIQQYDQSIDIVVGPKTPDLQLMLTSLFGVGREESIIPFVLLRHAREPMDKKVWVTPGEFEFEDDPVIVRQATPIAEYAMAGGYKVVGTDNTFLERPEPEMNPPRVGAGEWFTGPGQVVAGAEAARAMRLEPGHAVAAESWMTHPRTGDPLWRRELTVVGVLEPTGLAYDRMFYTGLEEAFDLHRAAIPLDMMRQTRDQMGISYILIWVHEGREAQLQDFFDNYTVTKTLLVDEQIEAVERLLGGGELLGRLMGGLLAGLGLLCMMAVFNSRFEAMGEDLAVMRALGLGKSRVAAWLLWESLIIWACAIPLTMGAERLLVGVLGRIPDISIFHVAMTWPTALHPWVWALSLLGCPLAMLIPLLRLYRSDVHAALKGM